MAKKFTAWMMMAVLVLALIIIPAPTVHAAETCMVRVNLSTIGAPSSVQVQVNGIYSIPNRPDIALISGQDYTIRYTGSGLTISGSGINGTVDLGSSFTMQSYSDTSGNVGYLYVRDIARSYRGDMTYYSSGYVQLVNRVFIEDYVVGVVRGEMGNSFPLEALKAQAIAARTYAYKRLKTSGTYDIGDTSSDQVYRGYRSGDTSIIQAVNDTKGLIVHSGSSVIDTYFGASNGGQTELVGNKWSSRETGNWTVMKDDPYDFRNPSSPVDSISISKSGSIANYSLDQVLRQRLGNYSGSILGVSNITLSSPRQYVSGSDSSRYYMNITFDLILPEDGGNYGGGGGGVGDGGTLGGGGLLGGGGGGSSSSGTVQYTGNTVIRSVTISTQSDLLTIVSPSYKLSLFTIVDNGSSFRIEGRRYGHGVGMSQRGAEQMANENIGYRDIMTFYYPNTSLVDHGFVSATTMSGSGQVITTPPPTATSTPDPGTSGALGTGVVTASTLNVRAQPMTTSAKLGSLSRSSTVSIMADTGDFYAISYQSTVGFVAKAYIQITSTGTETTATPTPTPTSTSNVQGATGTGEILPPNNVASVNVYASPGTDQAVISMLGQGVAVQMVHVINQWTYITYQGGAGYVLTEYILPKAGTIVTAAPTATAVVTATPVPQASTGTIKTNGGTVNVRSNPSTSGSVVAKAANGATVTVLSKTGDWYQISAGSITGYISASYVSVSGSVPDSGTTTTTATPTPAASGQATIVLSSSSSAMNLRSGPGTSYSVVTTMRNGDAVTTGAVTGDWVAVTTTSGYTGYVKTIYVSTYTGGATTSTTTGTIKVSSTVNLRSGPGTSFSKVGVLSNGSKVNLGEEKGDWVAVSTGSINGYVLKKYVSTSSSSGGSTNTGNSTSSAKTTGNVHLRAKASASSSSLGVVPNGTSVTLVNKGSEFSQVTYNGKDGYISNKFLKF